MGTLLVIGGPTASGKSALALNLARRLGAPILSADSRQVYRGMDIGTAKPSMAERAEVPHFFIDIRDPEQGYDVGQFVREAGELIPELMAAYGSVIVVGGTGLYLRALRHGLDDFPEVPEQIRSEIRHRLETQGIHALQEALIRLDPGYARDVDMDNPQRLIRALAVCEWTGRPFSSFRRQKGRPLPYPVLQVLLEPDRPRLYDRINRRVDDMMAAGLAEEARGFLGLRHLDALRTVGYQELFEWMDGRLTLAEAVDLIRRNTRRYAKRQLTWFRKEVDWLRFDPDQETDLPGTLEDRLRSAEGPPPGDARALPSGR